MLQTDLSGIADDDLLYNFAVCDLFSYNELVFTISGMGVLGCYLP